MNPPPFFDLGCTFLGGVMLWCSRVKKGIGVVIWDFDSWWGGFVIYLGLAWCWKGKGKGRGGFG